MSGKDDQKMTKEMYQREIKLLLGRMDVESLNIVLRFVRHWAYSQARKEGTKNEQ